MHVVRVVIASLSSLNHVCVCCVLGTFRCALPQILFFFPRTGKTRGLGAGRKLKLHRREQRWADKDYNKANLGSEWKKPFAGCSHSKGIVLEKIGIEAKQPNSAIRKCVRVQLIKNGKKVACFVPRDGCLNFVDENDEVLVSGFGRKGHAVGDIPGVRFKVVKVSGVALSALFRERRKNRVLNFVEDRDLDKCLIDKLNII